MNAPRAPHDGMAPRAPLVGAAMVVGAAFLWGSLALFARALEAHGFAPLELASVRAAMGCVLLGAWLLLRRPALLRIRLRDAPFLAAYGTFAFALFAYFYFATVERTSIGVAVALLYTAPAFVVVLSRVIWRERIGGPQLGALALVLLGVFLVTGALRTLLTGAASVTAAAALLGLGSGFTYGLYTVFGRHALQRFHALTTLFYVLAFAAAGLAFLVPPWQALARTPAALPLLLAMGLFPTVVAYVLYLGALRRMRATSASMIAAVEPVIAAALGAIFLGERLGPDQYAGVLLVLAATLLLARRAMANA